MMTKEEVMSKDRKGTVVIGMDLWTVELGYDANSMLTHQLVLVPGLPVKVVGGLGVVEARAILLPWRWLGRLGRLGLWWC